jgi:N6-L-threonylcarbamoyladenine synthase
MEAHKSNINTAVEESLSQAGLMDINQVDAIAVTKGPGLEVCLRVGLRKAQVSCVNKMTFQ